MALQWPKADFDVEAERNAGLLSVRRSRRYIRTSSDTGRRFSRPLSGERRLPGASRRSGRRATSPAGSDTVASPQPPERSRAAASRVTTVIARPPRANATACVAGRSATRLVRRVGAEPVGVLAAQPQRARRRPAASRRRGRRAGCRASSAASRLTRVAVVDRPPVVGVDQREVDDLGALVDVGDAGHRQLHELLAEHLHPEQRRELVDEGRDLATSGRSSSSTCWAKSRTASS